MRFLFGLVSHTKVTNVVDTVGPAVVAIKHRDGRGQVAMAAFFCPHRLVVVGCLDVSCVKISRWMCLM